MMTKLRAGHAAEAVRLWLQSGLESKIPELSHEREFDAGSGPAFYPDFGRMARHRAPALEDEDDSESGSVIGTRSKKLG